MAGDPAPSILGYHNQSFGVVEDIFATQLDIGRTIKIQVIRVNCPISEVVEGFDFDILKMYYTGNGGNGIPFEARYKNDAKVCIAHKTTHVHYPRKNTLKCIDDGNAYMLAKTVVRMHDRVQSYKRRGFRLLFTTLTERRAEEMITTTNRSFETMCHVWNDVCVPVITRHCLGVCIGRMYYRVRGNFSATQRILAAHYKRNGIKLYQVKTHQLFWAVIMDGASRSFTRKTLVLKTKDGVEFFNTLTKTSKCRSVQELKDN
jgi:hypothetical protein